MRPVTVVGASLLAVCCTAGIPGLDGGGAVWAATDCLTVADQPFAPYRCDFTRDDDVHTTVCMHALLSPVFPWFQMQFMQSGVILRCSCEASGSFFNPKFLGSKTFLCHSANFPEGNLDGAGGTVTGSRITRGHYVEAAFPFYTWVYQCKPDPTC